MTDIIMHTQVIARVMIDGIMIKIIKNTINAHYQKHLMIINIAVYIFAFYNEGVVYEYKK